MAVDFGPCCFCGKQIEASDGLGPDPCRVTDETAKVKWQVWSCHAACFRERLAKPDGYPEAFLAPAHV